MRIQAMAFKDGFNMKLLFNWHTYEIYYKKEII